MGRVREVQDGDVGYVARKMRDADRREVAAATGREPFEALETSIYMSRIACSIVDATDVPVAIFGVAEADDVTGIVWLLGTDDLTRGKLGRQFLRECRFYLDRLHDHWPLLTNCVDERNTVHASWLRWVGCTFLRRHERYGYEQRPFLEFVRIRHV
jgi:hypothetical protein